MDAVVPSLLSDGLRIESLSIELDVITFTVVATAPSAQCPVCRHPADRVHKRRVRALADLPLGGARMRLLVRVRHFRCDNPSCTRKMFSERLPLAGVYARRTERLSGALLGVGFALGGEAGARLAEALGMPTNPDTLLDLIRAAPTPDVGSPRVLGVDDWALRKRHEYGTILVDLQSRRPVDLLPDRSAESCAAWLREHLGVEIISRDRGAAYAEGASEGAPEAIQVADRWHLLKNLGEAAERFLTREHIHLRAAAEAIAGEARPPPDSEPELAIPTTEPTRAEGDRRARRTRRMGRYEQVMGLHGRGAGLREIARTLGMGRETVRKFVRAGAFPERAPRVIYRTNLTPYEPYLRARWDEGFRNASALYDEIKDRGYGGSPSMVRQFLARWRTGPGKPGKPGEGMSIEAAPPPIRVRSPRQVARLLLRREEELLYLASLCGVCPAAGTVRRIGLGFGRMVRERDRAALEPWLESAERSGVGEMVGVAGGLRQDLAAVEAALSLEWSQGQTEGQINRLKLIKRQMYG